MWRFKYWYCKSRMIAYLDGELSAVARRRVARYIDECPACYAEYRQQREMRREIDAALPAFGRPTDDQLQRIWSGIQAAITAPEPQPRLALPRLQWGALMVVIGIMIVTPLMLSGPGVAPVVATQPVPAVRAVTTAIAAVTDESTTVVVTDDVAVRATPYSEMTNHVTAEITPAAAVTPGE